MNLGEVYFDAVRPILREHLPRRTVESIALSVVPAMAQLPHVSDESVLAAFADTGLVPESTLAAISPKLLAAAHRLAAKHLCLASLRRNSNDIFSLTPPRFLVFLTPRISPSSVAAAFRATATPRFSPRTKSVPQEKNMSSEPIEVTEDDSQDTYAEIILAPENVSVFMRLLRAIGSLLTSLFESKSKSKKGKGKGKKKKKKKNVNDVRDDAGRQ